MTGITAALAAGGGLLAEFSPAGGEAAGTATDIEVTGSGGAATGITATRAAVWSYTPTDRTGTDFTVSIASGATATVIEFTVTGGPPKLWNVQATAGGVTRYWTVYLYAEQ